MRTHAVEREGERDSTTCGVVLYNRFPLPLAHLSVRADCWTCPRSRASWFAWEESWWGRRLRRWTRSSPSQCMSLLSPCSCEARGQLIIYSKKTKQNSTAAPDGDARYFPMLIEPNFSLENLTKREVSSSFYFWKRKIIWKYINRRKKRALKEYFIKSSSLLRLVESHESLFCYMCAFKEACLGKWHKKQGWLVLCEFLNARAGLL